MSARHSVGEPFVHSAFLYRGDTEYLSGVLPFVQAGRAAGEPVTIAVPGSRLALLAEALGPAADVTLMDMTGVGRNPCRIIPRVLLAAMNAHPDSPVRIVGEPLWPSRSAAEYTACVVHEALINRVVAGRPVAVLCPYDADGLDATALDEAATTHPSLTDAGGPHTSRHYSPNHALAAHNLPLPAPDNADTYIVDTPNMAGLRSVAAKFACQHGLDEERTEELVLALTELASNSIEHARDSATVLLGVSGDRLVCQVRDSGHITDPLAGRRPVPPEHLRGRGLLLVNEVADLVRIHSVPGSTTVEIQFAGRGTAR